MTALEVPGCVERSPLFAGLNEGQLAAVVDGAEEEYFAKGRYVFRQGGEAERFYLLRQGRVAIEVSAPGKRTVTLQTLVPGEVLGWSWLLPPYTWHFDARACDDTQTVALDARKLRALMDRDLAAGHLLYRRFLAIMMERLQAARMQLLDLYAHDDL